MVIEVGEAWSAPHLNVLRRSTSNRFLIEAE